MNEQVHYETDLEYYQDLLLWLKQRLVLAVVVLRASRGEGFREGFGGVFVSDEEVNDILASFVEEQGDSEGQNATLAGLNQLWQDIAAKRRATSGLKIDVLTQFYLLSENEQFVLLLCFLVELEPRLAKVFAYLQDDVKLQCVTLSLCQTLSTEPQGAQEWHVALLYQEPLLQVPLLIAEPQGLQPMVQQLYCEDGIRNYLLGYHYPDHHLAAYLSIVLPQRRTISTRRFNAMQAPFAPTIESIEHLRQEVALSVWPVTRICCDDHQHLVQSIANKLNEQVYWLKAADGIVKIDFLRWIRECWLHKTVPVLSFNQPPPDWLSTMNHGYILLCSSQQLSEYKGVREDWLLETLALDSGEQQFYWRQFLPTAMVRYTEVKAMIKKVSEQFVFSRSTIEQISKYLSLQREHSEHRVHDTELLAMCRQYAAKPMVGLADHIHSPFGWDDLVISKSVKRQLQALQRAVQYSGSYIKESRLDKVLGASKGICGLFSGLSGTGKTMAAGIIANELSLDLYRVDLSRVVSKYIGETEKNLDKIFRAAENAQVVLFFDEGDALFGKRSEVKDAHDRYANIEVSYLLQKIEEHSGATIIATNFADNIDDAFTRRIDHMIVFPMPSETERKGIWQRVEQTNIELNEDIDFDWLARQFELSGGQIKNVILTACFKAKDQQTALSMVDLVKAAAVELRKIKQPINRTLFGDYFHLLDK